MSLREMYVQNLYGEGTNHFVFCLLQPFNGRYMKKLEIFIIFPKKKQKQIELEDESFCEAEIYLK